ncbi:F0F1 ATP synthase subunit A [Candidatus Berkelbacteria bacterium]|nr:F0F1 ATP synthase subunit A [Candidatus Berkelbacteria bacterium]
MHEIHLASNVLFNIGPLAVTNAILATWLGMLVILAISAAATFNLKSIPTGFQNLVEWIIEELLGLIEGVTGDRRRAEQFLPILATFFVFILVMNWMELIPGFGSLTIGGTPLLRSANTDLNTPLALALISVIGTQIFGILAVGFWQNLGHYISFKGPIEFFVGILHLIGELAKIMSFAFRLFGNIFAGEVLLVVITFLVPYIVPMPFYAIEVFVGFVQALVFTMLTLVFMTIATTPHHEAEGH